MNAGRAGKTVRSLRMRAILERLRGVFTTKRYTNPRLPYLYLTLGFVTDNNGQRITEYANTRRTTVDIKVTKNAQL